jgi:hypothetical protein
MSPSIPWANKNCPGFGQSSRTTLALDAEAIDFDWLQTYFKAEFLIEINQLRELGAINVAPPLPALLYQLRIDLYLTTQKCPAGLLLFPLLDHGNLLNSNHPFRKQNSYPLPIAQPK